jgi:hypothetical protein
MLRDQALVPLSHQHHNALALCVRIQRGLAPEPVARWTPASPETLQAEIEKLFEREIRYHFQAEEEVLFPVAQTIPGLTALASELVAEHALLRDYAARGRKLGADELRAFAELLAAHVRKEEGRLFEGLQASLAPSALAQLGERLEAWFRSSGMPGAACELPS